MNRILEWRFWFVMVIRSGISMEHWTPLKIFLLGGFEHFFDFSMGNNDPNWLILFGTWIVFFHSVRNVIVPTDELIFFRGVGIPLTSFELLDIAAFGCKISGEYCTWFTVSLFYCVLTRILGKISRAPAQFQTCVFFWVSVAAFCVASKQNKASSQKLEQEVSAISQGRICKSCCNMLQWLACVFLGLFLSIAGMHVAAALSIANCRSLVYSSLYLSANYLF